MSQSTEPSFVPPKLDGKIVFARAGGRFKDETVFVANADGTDEQQVGDLGVVCCPFVSRDGRRLAMTTPSEDDRSTTVIMNLDGSDRVLIPLPDKTLQVGAGPFSPDGTHMAFDVSDEAHPTRDGIYIGSASDGTGRVRIVQSGKVHYTPGDFSPDGSQLVVFRPFKDVEEYEGVFPSPGSLFVVNRDGTGLHQLTPGDLKVECCNNYRWSRDGTRILFADFGGSLWLIGPDGKRLTEIFKGKEGHYGYTPTWSPDGSEIMFANEPVTIPFTHPANSLSVLKADGTDLRPVIGTNDFKWQPSWVSAG